MNEVMDCSPGENMMEGRPREIAFSRRKQLMALAAELAEVAMSKTEPHERCLLRRMVESLVDR